MGINTDNKRYWFKNQLFWAERGLIHIEDQNTGEYRSLSREEAASRAIALNEGVRHLVYPDEIREASDAVCALCACVKAAKNQGDPHDPEARRIVARENRKVSILFDFNQRRSGSSRRILLGSNASIDKQLAPKPVSKLFKEMRI